jgi:hypothetical protein
MRKAYIGGFCFEKNFEVHAETGLHLFSSRGCVAFLPMVLSNFLGDEPICTLYA